MLCYTPPADITHIQQLFNKFNIPYLSELAPRLKIEPPSNKRPLSGSLNEISAHLE